MKKNATRYCAGPAYYRMCSTDVAVQNKPGNAFKGNHHPSFLRFWNWAEESMMQPKFVAAQKMLLKQKLANIRNGLLGFITLGIYTPLEALLCAHNNCMSCPSIWATLSALLINILLGFLPVVFCIVISLSLRVK